jgi:hypothetical protein
MVDLDEHGSKNNIDEVQLSPIEIIPLGWK